MTKVSFVITNQKNGERYAYDDPDLIMVDLLAPLISVGSTFKSGSLVGLTINEIEVIPPIEARKYSVVSIKVS